MARVGATRRLGAVLLGALAVALPARAETLRVFAAASLTEAFGELAAAYERAHPGVKVEVSFAGSQVLRTQIEQGAPADVFASADPAQAAALVQAGLLGPTRVFATNRLVLAVPAQGGRVRRLDDLALPGVKVVLAGPAVPAGRYAAQVLARLAASGSYGPGYEARVLGNVVSHETSVRAALARVALGEAEAAFVYATDVASARAVRAIEVPERCNVTAEYPVGVLARSPRAARARDFVELLLGEPGQAVLRRHGFGPQK